MKIELKEILIQDIADGYIDNEENGVLGYSGNLNIRPAFQREFIYRDKQRDEVIRTILKNFPLNVMYWVKNNNGTYELLDGQQRTISICQYIQGDFSVDHFGFNNLSKSEQEQILNYPLMIYICEGNDKEKLDWFKIINIAGEQLTQQELRNAIYTGEWLTEAKKYFSKRDCPAYIMASDYLSGSPIRQDYLETVISWIATRDGLGIVDYMAKNQHETNCNEIWLYFQAVISWVQAIFPKYRKEMKGLDWGLYYNKHKDKKLDPKILEAKIIELMEDDDVTKNSGIYEYLLDGNEKHLSIRAFTPKMARAAYEKQKGICPKCGNKFEFAKMQADHIVPWSKGGKTIQDNCQMLCATCNREKSNL